MKRDIYMEACPVCGKLPKIKYEHGTYQTWCRIRCRPFLGRPHMEVIYGSPQSAQALRRASERWNVEVKASKLTPSRYIDSQRVMTKAICNALIKLEEVSKERDALKADLEMVINADMSRCEICLHNGTDCEARKTTAINCWEWRGILPAENEQQQKT